MIIFDFNTPVTARDDLNIIVADEQDDGYTLVVIHSAFEEPIIKRPNLLCRDRPWSEESIIDMVYDLVMYDTGNPRTKIPNQVFDDMDLDLHNPDFSMGMTVGEQWT